MEQSILLGIWELGKSMDSLSIVKNFTNGLRTMDLEAFIVMVRSFNASLTNEQIKYFFSQVITEYQCRTFTSFIIDQLIRKAAKINIKQRSLIIRTPDEILAQISTLLASKKLDMIQVFSIFSLTQTDVMTEQEFEQFIDYYIPTISKEEYVQLRGSLRFRLGAPEISRWIQEGSQRQHKKIIAPVCTQVKGPVISPRSELPNYKSTVSPPSRQYPIGSPAQKLFNNEISPPARQFEPQYSTQNRFNTAYSPPQRFAPAKDHQPIVPASSNNSKGLQTQNYNSLPAKTTQWQPENVIQYHPNQFAKQYQASPNLIDKKDQPKQTEPIIQSPTIGQSVKPKDRAINFFLAQTYKPITQNSQSQEQNKESIHPKLAQTLSLVKTAINFQEIVKLDHPLPGLDNFIRNFHQLDQTKQQYTDSSFPANQTSLGMKAGNFPWKRLSDIWGDKHQIFEKDQKHPSVGLGEWIDAEDILQGALGDCYFLSSLSVIAMKWPLVIFNAFLTQKANHVGMYAVKYFVDGIETCIVIDDFIPVNGDKPAFTQSTGDESWVMLLEKAWAKVFDSYSNIIAGRSIEVLKCFLGGPTWTIKTDDKDFRNKLQDAVDKDCAMTVGTFAENTGKNFKEMGLVPGHAYACLGVRYIQHPQRGKVELIKLRNPWGKTEWKGDWSDSSPLWKPELRDEGSEDDGIFHMQYEHFIMYYQSVDCAYYKENYKYQAIPYRTKKNKALYASFELPEDGEYYISIHQKSERHYRSKYQNYKYSQMRLVLGLDSGQGQFKFVDAKGAVYQDDFVGGQLKKGKYVLSAKINWAYSQDDDMAVSIYGPNKVELNIIQKSQVPQFHEQVMLDRARQNKETTSFKESDQIRKCNEIKMEWGLGYFYYSNKSNKTLEMDISFTQMQGLKLKKPNRMNKYKVQVPPGKEQIVLVTVASDGFGMGQSMSYSVK